jgi:RNA polymerase sigma factor (sigma-70 family)
MPEDELLAVDEALDRLATVDTRAAQIVKLCFFVGLTQAEAAQELGVSVSTAERLWAFARAWLLRALKETRPTSA